MISRQIKAIINSVTNDSMTRMEAYEATRKEIDITWQVFKRHYTTRDMIGGRKKIDLIIEDIEIAMDRRQEIIKQSPDTWHLTEKRERAWDDVLITTLTRRYYLTTGDKVRDLLEKQKKLHKVKENS